MCVFFIIVVFFFKQKTAYEMRISDWSSDVCSSDLVTPATSVAAPAATKRVMSPLENFEGDLDGLLHAAFGFATFRPFQREVCERSEERRVGKECVSSVDLGGRRIIKKNKHIT